MKRLLFLAFLFMNLFSCTNEPPKILFLVREGSNRFEFMLDNELEIMSEILKNAGYEVNTATLTGETVSTNSTSFTPDFKLGNVNLNDYAGLVIPCMAGSGIAISTEEIEFVKKVVEEQKPVAAQLSAVRILAQAGVLDGKKFAYAEEKDWNSGMYPEFHNGIFNGTGVVKDGLIVTSGTCPWMSQLHNIPDGTTRFTLAFISVLKSASE